LRPHVLELLVDIPELINVIFFDLFLDFFCRKLLFEPFQLPFKINNPVDHCCMKIGRSFCLGGPFNKHLPGL